MIALALKDTPEHWRALWWTSAFNLGICFANILVGNTVFAIVSLIIAIVSLQVIKRNTQQMLWDKLTARNNEEYTN